MSRAKSWKELGSPDDLTVSNTPLGFHIIRNKCLWYEVLDIWGSVCYSSWHCPCPYLSVLGEAGVQDQGGSSYRQSQTLGFESPFPRKRRERGPYLPLLLYGFNEIIYLESTPGAVKGISDVSYI